MKGAKIHVIKEEKFFLKPLSSTFHARDVFAPVCAHLSLGRRVEDFGPKALECKMLPVKEPFKNKGEIVGEVIHVDRFGNLVTNIEGELLPKNPCIKIKDVKIYGLSTSYQQVPKHHFLAIIGSGGLLEISANCANASLLLNCGRAERVIVTGR
jgi:hypothetical protein